MASLTSFAVDPNSAMLNPFQAPQPTGMAGSWGVATAPLSSQYASGSQQQSSGGSYHTNPSLVDSMARNFAGLYENVVPRYNDFMSDPVNSQAFQTQLQSLLAKMVPGEMDAREQLTDRFRAAGGLRSGAHGVAGARLEGDIIGRRQDAAGTLLGQVIQQMTQLYGLPMSQMAPLIQALELQSQQSTGQSWGAGSGSRGAGGSYGPSTMAPVQGAGKSPFGEYGSGSAYGGGGGGGTPEVWQDDWTGGGWYPANTPSEDRFWPEGGGGGWPTLTPNQDMDPWTQE